MNRSPAKEGTRMAKPKLDGDLLRWGIVLGGLLSNQGFQKQFFALLDATDGPREDFVKLIAAIERGDNKSVRSFVEQIVGVELEKEESAMSGILRRVHVGVVAAARERAHTNLRHDSGQPIEEWIEWAKSQVAMVEKKHKRSQDDA